MNGGPVPSSGYVYCAHCEENVSESTFQRHQILASGSNTIKQLEMAVRNYSADSESKRSSSPDLFQGGVYFVSKVVRCDVLYHTL